MKNVCAFTTLCWVMYRLCGVRFPFHRGCHASHFDRDGWIKCTFYLRNSKNITRCDDDDDDDDEESPENSIQFYLQCIQLLPRTKLINIKIWNDYEFCCSIAMIMMILRLFFHKNLTTKLIQVLNFWHKWNTRRAHQPKWWKANRTEQTKTLRFSYFSRTIR